MYEWQGMDMKKWKWRKMKSYPKHLWKTMYNNALFGKVQNVSPNYVEHLGKCTNSGEMLKTYPLFMLKTG